MTTEPQGSTIDAFAMGDCLEAAFKQIIESHFNDNQQFSQMLQNTFASYMPVPPQVWPQFLQAQKTAIETLRGFQPAAELLKQAGDPDLATMFSDAISVMETTIQNVEAKMSGPSFGFQPNMAPPGQAPSPSGQLPARSGFVPGGSAKLDSEEQRKAHEMAMQNMNAQRQHWARIDQINKQTSNTIFEMQAGTMKKRRESEDRIHKAFISSI